MNKFLDKQHNKGNALAAKDIMAIWLDEFNMFIHKHTAGRLLNIMGLEWSPIKAVSNTCSLPSQFDSRLLDSRGQDRESIESRRRFEIFRLC